jgi:hypothetical protein
MSNYKTVMLPLEVPKGRYCWQYGKVNTPLCEFYDNEGGHSTCMLGVGFTPREIRKDSTGIQKDPRCNALRRR